MTSLITRTAAADDSIAATLAVRCGNPLAEEPAPFNVALVQRFGALGLMILAVGCWIKRTLAS